MSVAADAGGMAENADGDSDGLDGPPEPTFREHFWNLMCGYKQLWYTLFVLSIALLTIQLLALTQLSPADQAAYTLSTINLVILVVTIAGTGYVTLHCRDV
jgi:hypothetical protein